jgi:putative transcriptional regulator
MVGFHDCTHRSRGQGVSGEFGNFSVTQGFAPRDFSDYSQDFFFESFHVCHQYSMCYTRFVIMKEVITNNILKLRTTRGITQEELAERVGVSRQTVIAIERGNYTPSVALALRLADFFGAPVEKIFNIRNEK